jgi:hypothetical protein
MGACFIQRTLCPSKIMHKITLSLILLTLLLSSCDRIKQRGRKYFSAVIDELREPVLTGTQIIDLYPELKKDEFKVQSLNGLQAQYLPAFYEYYFKYTGDQEKVLGFICGLQVDSYSDIKPDSSCTMIGANAEIDKNGLSEETLKKLSYFFEHSTLDEYKVYQTIKTPFEHTLIVDQNSDAIYHRIKEFRE